MGKNNNSWNHFNFRKCRLANIKDTYKAAVCIGRQPNIEVWVFGPDLQLAANGWVTTAESTSILWVKEVFNIEEGKRRDQAGCLPSIRLPLYGHALYQVIKALLNTVHDNLMAAIFTIGMTFYHWIMSIFFFIYHA